LQNWSAREHISRAFRVLGIKFKKLAEKNTREHKRSCCRLSDSARARILVSTFKRISERIMSNANPIAYSPQNAHTAFDPPCSKRVITAALRKGELVAHRVGVRAYITREALTTWINHQRNIRS
jgi:hypothetical protein